MNPAINGWAIVKDLEQRPFSKQRFLRGVAFRSGFLEIQVRRVVGMLGALFAIKQAFNRQQLDARKLPAGSVRVKARARGVADHAARRLFQGNKQTNLGSRFRRCARSADCLNPQRVARQSTLELFQTSPVLPRAASWDNSRSAENSPAIHGWDSLPAIVPSPARDERCWRTATTFSAVPRGTFLFV